MQKKAYAFSHELVGLHAQKDYWEGGGNLPLLEITVQNTGRQRTSTAENTSNAVRYLFSENSEHPAVAQMARSRATCSSPRTVAANQSHHEPYCVRLIGQGHLRIQIWLLATDHPQKKGAQTEQGCVILLFFRVTTTTTKKHDHQNQKVSHHR